MGVTYNSTLDYYSSKVITSGLIVHLDAANPRSYPGTGSIWYDLTGNNRNGLKLGASATTFPCFNSRGYFNFIGGVVATNYSRFIVSGIPDMAEVSVICWSKLTNQGTFLRMQNSDFEISVFNTNYIAYAAGANYNDIQAVSYSTPQIVNGEWHQTALTYNGYQLSGYLDGAYVTSSARAGNAVSSISAGSLNVGTRNDAYSQHLVGDIAQILIYNRCLTATEIKYMYDLYYRRFLY